METQSETGLQADVHEEPTKRLELLVTEDKMEAVLLVEETKDLSTTEAEEAVKNLIAEKGVIFGVDQEAIQQFLNDLNIPGEKKYTVARGTAPEPGQDAAVLFKIGNEQRPGTLDEYSKMDFRDRGGIFQVKEGDIVAVKIPMVKGVDGETVTGKKIPAPPVHDAALKLGRNVQLRDDNVEAKVSGIVCTNSAQEIEITPVLSINGNLDFSVGNVDFNGLVEVSGNILSGFKVRAGSLIAAFVEHDTKLEVKGDMVIKEGLIGSEVKVGGILKCAYMKGTRISSENDVIVETEIVDSSVSTLGKVIVTRPNGRIINSTVLARLGIETQNFGSRSSPYCMAVLGVDHRRDAQIQALNEEILRLGETLTKLENKFKEISDLKQYVEKSIQELKDQLPASRDRRQKYRLQAQAKDLCQKHKELIKNYSLLLDTIVSYKGEKRDKETERERLIAESARVEPDIYLKVKGLLHEGSVIRGKTARLDIKESMEGVRAHESVFTEELEDGRQNEIVKIELKST